MHMNSAYFAEIVLMRALFRNLDYLPCYQKKRKAKENKDEKPFFSLLLSLFLRTLISARGHATEPGAPYLRGYNELKESWLLRKPLTF